MSTRWTLPDLPSAVTWCKNRNTTGIRCSLAILGEHAVDMQESFRWVRESVECIRAIEKHQLDASLSLKLTAIGAIFDHDYCRDNTLKLFSEAAKRHVSLEIDMEGRGLVDLTIGTAIAVVRQGYPVTLALQAYLDRTPKDLQTVFAAGISPRIVKGAYSGDTRDFTGIQEKFRELVNASASGTGGFSVATHDPGLLSWIEDRLADEKNRVETCFLMGLADQTKEKMVSEGWAVSEYVPYGEAQGPYIARREFYLDQLREMGRSPLP